MAFVLKRPFDGSPGVIIFTHKEFQYFTESHALLSDAIKQLKGLYLFGVHWGHFATDVDSPPDVDFHLAGAGTLSLRNKSSTRVVPLCSRNFTPALFQPDGVEKYWDIIMVARPLRLKKIDDFFKVLKKIISVRPQTRALLVCPTIPRPDKKYVYVEMFSDYLTDFSESERENITLLTPSEQLYPFPLGQGAMAYLFNRSRYFTLFSEQEGESRVIAEALLCGLPVFVRKTLRGGGRDYLTNENSSQFADIDEAAAMFLDATEGRRTFSVDSDGLARELRTDLSEMRLTEFIKAIFLDLGQPYAGGMDLKGLDRKLPSHCRILPEHIRSQFTDDIRSERAFVEFSNLLSGGSLPLPARTTMAMIDLRRGSARFINRMVGLAIALKRRFIPAWLWPSRRAP